MSPGEDGHLLTRRSKRIAGCLAVFCGCVLIKHAQAQFAVPPPPPPVFNPSPPNTTVPQPSYTPNSPATPSAVPGPEVTSPVNEAPSVRSARRAAVEKPRSVHHHHRGRFAGLGWPYYCGSSPCVRIVVPEPPPVYRASVLWWPGYYDYAPGQFARGRPPWGGYPRPSGYHGD
jgi:hypothetical protein